MVLSIGSISGSWSRNRRVNDRAPDPVAPFGPGRRDVSAHCGAVEKLHQVCRVALFSEQLEECFEQTGSDARTASRYCSSCRTAPVAPAR